MIDYYQILGITDAASTEEIKAAFKKLAIIYHPDKNPGNSVMEEKFKEINQAYQVLSNPYQKARYDLMRSYGSPTETPPPNYQYPPYEPPPQRRRYRRPEPTIDYEENWKATLYAFAFTFVVALLVMSVIGAKTYYDKVKNEERLASRGEVFQRALSHHKDGNLDSTFYLINSLGLLDEEYETQILTFKSKLVADTKYLGELNFVNQNFSEAIYYLELLDRHTDIKELSLKEALAVSYRQTQQPDKSIHVLTQLLMRGYKKIQTFVFLAEVYRDEKSDPEQALFYFEKANIAAKEYYEAAYGKAYAVILSGHILPEIHYRLYTGLAEIYLVLDQPSKAISVTNWNKQVWPDRPENFTIAAKSYEKLGNPEKAFQELSNIR